MTILNKEPWKISLHQQVKWYTLPSPRKQSLVQANEDILTHTHTYTHLVTYTQ